MEQTPLFRRRSFKIILIILILILIGQIFFYIKDKNTIQTVNDQIAWLEQFYTENARFPSENEFYSRYEKNKRIEPLEDNYKIIDIDKSSNGAPQNFSLKYKLHFQDHFDTLGAKRRDYIPFYLYTEVTPCHRWKEISEFAPRMVIHVKPNTFIQANLETGSITLKENPEKKLLTELKQPRFLHAWPGFNSSYAAGNEVFITNGNDVVRYTWDPSTQSLNNPEKIGNVPTGCPAYTNYTWSVI